MRSSCDGWVQLRHSGVANELSTRSKNLPIYESRITATDLSPAGTAVATACYDSTSKVWCQDFPGDVKMKAETDQ